MTKRQALAIAYANYVADIHDLEKELEKNQHRSEADMDAWDYHQNWRLRLSEGGRGL